MAETKLPTGIRVQGGMLNMRIKRPGRGWEWEATGLAAHQVEEAAKLRAATQAFVDAGQEDNAAGKMTVKRYARRWIKDRRDRGLLSVDDDERRLRLHVLSHAFESGRRFAAMLMTDVRPSHARAIVKALDKKGLAPRTVINTHSLAASMFKDAVADEVIDRLVWVVPKKELPKKRDKDPAWRASAKFEPEEIQALLWAAEEHAPWDRRVFYALCYFGALRFGEAAARRWRDINDTHALPSIHVHNSFSTTRGEEGETKTEGTRRMPLHPTLSVILDEWREKGWRNLMGRDPTDDDLIVPSRQGSHRRKNHMLHKLHEDLGRLGLRPRRQHDLRRSFISHAVDAGASRERLKPGTHGLGTTVLELYDTPAWSACCEAVLKLRLDRHEFMGRPWGETQKANQIKRVMVEAPGIENGGANAAGQSGPAKERRISALVGRQSRPVAADRGAFFPILPTAAERARWTTMARFSFVPARAS